MWTMVFDGEMQRLVHSLLVQFTTLVIYTCISLIFWSINPPLLQFNLEAAPLVLTQCVSLSVTLSRS